MSSGSATGMSPRELRMGPRGFLTWLPVPAPGPSGPVPRRSTLSRLGFLCAFPMIFLSLTTNLWAIGRAFPTIPPCELMASFIINPWAWFLAAFLARIMSVQRPKDQRAGYPRLLPVLLMVESR